MNYLLIFIEILIIYFKNIKYQNYIQKKKKNNRIKTNKYKWTVGKL